MSDKQRDQLLAAYLLNASENITKESAWKSRKKAPKGRVYSKGKWVKKKKKSTQAAMDKEAYLGGALNTALNTVNPLGSAVNSIGSIAKGVGNMFGGGNKPAGVAGPVSPPTAPAKPPVAYNPVTRQPVTPPAPSPVTNPGAMGGGNTPAATPAATTPATPAATTPATPAAPAQTPAAPAQTPAAPKQPFNAYNFYQGLGSDAQAYLNNIPGFQAPQAPKGGIFGRILQQIAPSLYTEFFGGQQGGGQQGGGQQGAPGGGGVAADAGGGQSGGQAGGSKFDGRAGYNKLDPQMQAYLQQHGFKMPAQKQQPADTSQADVEAGKADAQAAGTTSGAAAGTPSGAGAAAGGSQGTQFAKYDEYTAPTQDDIQNAKDLWANQTGTVMDAYNRNDGKNDLNRKWTQQTATQLAGLRSAGYDTRGMSMKQVRDLHRKLKGGSLEQGTYSSDGMDFLDSADGNVAGGAGGAGVGAAGGATAATEDPDAMSFDDIIAENRGGSPDVEAGRVAAGGGPVNRGIDAPFNAIPEEQGVPQANNPQGMMIADTPVPEGVDTSTNTIEPTPDFEQGQQDAIAGSSGGSGAGAAVGATGATTPQPESTQKTVDPDTSMAMGNPYASNVEATEEMKRRQDAEKGLPDSYSPTPDVDAGRAAAGGGGAPSAPTPDEQIADAQQDMDEGLTADLPSNVGSASPTPAPSSGSSYTPMSGGPSVGSSGRAGRRSPSNVGTEPKVVGGKKTSRGSRGGTVTRVPAETGPVGSSGRAGRRAAQTESLPDAPPGGFASAEELGTDALFGDNAVGDTPGGFASADQAGTDALFGDDAIGATEGDSPATGRIGDDVLNEDGTMKLPDDFKMPVQEQPEAPKPGRGGLPDNVSIGGTMGGAVRIPEKPSNEESDAPAYRISDRSPLTPGTPEAKQVMDEFDSRVAPIGGDANVPGGFASKQKDKNFANMELPTQREPGTSAPPESDIAGSAASPGVGAAGGATGAVDEKEEEPEAPAQQGGGRGRPPILRRRGGVGPIRSLIGGRRYADESPTRGSARRQENKEKRQERRQNRRSRRGGGRLGRRG